MKQSTITLYVLLAESTSCDPEGNPIFGVYCKAESGNCPPRIRRLSDIHIGKSTSRVGFFMEGQRNCLFESKAVVKGLIARAINASGSFYGENAIVFPVRVFKKNGYFAIDTSSFNTEEKVKALLIGTGKTSPQAAIPKVVATTDVCAGMLLEDPPKEEFRPLNQECEQYIKSVYDAHSALFQQLLKQERLILKLAELQVSYKYPGLDKIVDKLVHRQTTKIRQKAEDVVYLFDADQFDDTVLTIRNS